MYTDAFERAVDHAMLYEVGGFWNSSLPGVIDGTDLKACGYGNDPTDPGGETKYGVAKNANPDVDIKNLDWEGAKAIYYNHYWLAGSCDKLPGRVGALHFDGCVNNGVKRAGQFLQRAVNVADDGIVGSGTVAAVNREDPFVVCRDICDQRTQYYKNIVANNPSQAKYLNGWLRRISEMRVFVLNPTISF